MSDKDQMNSNSSEPISILLIEEDELTRSTIRNMLEHLKYKVEITQDFESALPLLARIRFDVMLLKLRNSDQDGKLIGLRIKEMQPYLKIVVVSGRLLEEEISPYIGALLRKPYTLDLLNNTIRSLV